MNINLNTPAASFSRGRARTAEHAAKDISEVFEACALKTGKIKTRTIESSTTSAGRSVERTRTKLIILRTLLFVREYLIRLIDLFKLRLITPLFIRMMLMRQN